MLAINQGTPIALIIGGPHHNEYVGLIREEDPEYEELEVDPIEIAAEYIKDKHLNLSEKQMDELENALADGREPPLSLRSLHKEILKLCTIQRDREVQCRTGVLSPISVDFPEQNARHFIAGPSGAGKSYICNEILQNIIGEDPKKKIFVFSKLDSDPVLEKDISENIFRLPIKELIADPDFKKKGKSKIPVIPTAPVSIPPGKTEIEIDILPGNPLPSGNSGTTISPGPGPHPRIEEIKEPLAPLGAIDESEIPANCICVFDDIEGLRGEEREAVTKLRDQLLNVGRHKNITIFTIVHRLLGGKNTTESRDECTTTTVFPKAGMKHHIEQYLEKYRGLSKSQIKRILNR